MAPSFLPVYTFALEHQYADDTQLYLAMRVDNTAAGLSILAACTTDVKEWYMQNGLQLSPKRSLWAQPHS